MPLKLIFQLGWRNLWRHRRRNGLVFASILVAISTIVLAAALIRGWQVDMLETVVGNLTGHVKVLAPGYQADPSIERSFPVPSDWRPGLPPELLVGWTSRVVVPGVVLSERETRGVMLVGIDPGDEQDISFLRDVEIEGEMLSGADDGRVLVGAALAEQLNTGVDRRIVLMTSGSDGRNRESGFRVAGLYDAQVNGLEKGYVFTGRQTLQGMLDTAAVTELSLRLTDNLYVDRARDQLESGFAGLDVQSWDELEPQAAALFQFADVAIFVWFAILMTALGFGLVNTLVMAVMERVKELGMLRAVGMRPATVIAQVVVECLLIVTVGVLLGLALGMWFVYLLSDGIDLSDWSEGTEMVQMSALLVPRLWASDLVLIAWLSLVFGFFASLYPAWRAVQVGPLEAMRK
jgi:ABC-type lipoprotein release transport system permease subunit